jgi:hypothetical protein
MIARRTFLASGIALLGAPLAAEAQEPTKIARIGYLTTADVSTAPHHLRESFLKGLVTSVTSRVATS